MPDAMDLKCPGCGGSMVFDPALQKLKCPFCNTLAEVESFSPPLPEKKKSARTKTRAADWEEIETQDLRTYTCDSCGGQLLGEATLGAAVCPFCGSHLVMGDQFSGKLRPELVLPFEITKDQAVQAYRSSFRKQYFSPRTFRAKARIDQIQGVYIPFWLFDLDAEGNFEFFTTDRESYRQGNVEHVKETYYYVSRGGRLSFEKLPVDASEKMDNALLQDLEPFDLSKAVPFQKAYLSGFSANRYDLTPGKARPEAVDRAIHTMELEMKHTITHGYSKPSGNSVWFNSSTATYALLPVWLLTLNWQGKPWTFAVNGQTGKVAGDHPLDRRQLILWLITRTLGLSLIFLAVSILKRLF